MQVEQLTKDGAVTKKIIKEGLGKTPESKNIVSGKAAPLDWITSVTN